MPNDLTEKWKGLVRALEQVQQGAYSPLFAYMVEREKQKVEKEAHM